ncbi:MAG: MMPL family transporter [bacterium]|nr:MMPL family transporter [bacterium]
MQQKLLEKIYQLSLNKGKTLLAVMGIITLIMGSLIFILKLEISSSHMGLVSPDDPAQARYLEFIKEFGASDNLVVVLEGDYDTLKANVEKFAGEIQNEEKWVKSIFYKIDTSLFIKRAPFFAPLEELEKTFEAVSTQKALIKKAAAVKNLPSVLKEVHWAIKKPVIDIEPKDAPKVINGLNVFFGEWNSWVSSITHNRIETLDKLLMSNSNAGHLIKSDGYLFSRDFRMLYLFVQPASSNDEVDYLRPFISDIRKAGNRVYENNPELKGKVKMAFTGMPAHILTENETVFADIKKAGSISIILVAVILLVGFGSLRKMMLCLIPLVSGMIIALGLITVVVGRLNLISSAFLAVLFGIGIDFGIYLIRRTEEELGNGKTREEAVHRAVVITGKGIVTGGLTTGLAFLALMFSSFSGYSELGTSAGLGILVVLATTFLMLPALLLLEKIEPHHYDTIDTIVEAKETKRRATLWTTMILTILFGGWSVFGIINNKFDYNVLKLLPQDVESTEYQLKMEEQSDFKMSFAAITSNNLEDLRKDVNKMKKLPEVSRVDSLSEMIPDNQDKKLKIIKRLKPIFNNINISYKHNNKAGAKEYSRLLEKLLDFFEETQEKAFVGNQAALAASLDKLIENISELNESLTGPDAKIALMRTRAFERALFMNIAQMADMVSVWMDATPLSEGSFSKEIMSRFKSPGGKYVAYVFPRGSIWEVEFLDKFVAGLKNIRKDVTGFPITHSVYIREAVNGVIFPILYSLLVVIVLLAIDFRKAEAVVLALVPLAIGMLGLQGMLYLVGVSYNVANIAGLPLLLGLGVVYGVHIVHRWLENREVTAFVAAKTTGRGVSFAAFTTITGLFSIVFAHHGGASSFGIILLLGIILCLVSSLYILPAIIDLLYLKEKNGEKIGTKNKEKNKEKK